MEHRNVLPANFAKRPTKEIGGTCPPKPRRRKRAHPYLASVLHHCVASNCTWSCQEAALLARAHTHAFSDAPARDDRRQTTLPYSIRQGVGLIALFNQTAPSGLGASGEPRWGKARGHRQHPGCCTPLKARFASTAGDARSGTGYTQAQEGVHPDSVLPLMGHAEYLRSAHWPQGSTWAAGSFPVGNQEVPLIRQAGMGVTNSSPLQGKWPQWLAHHHYNPILRPADWPPQKGHSRRQGHHYGWLGGRQKTTGGRTDGRTHTHTTHTMRTPASLWERAGAEAPGWMTQRPKAPILPPPARASHTQAWERHGKC